MLRKEKNYILNGPLGMDGSIRENVGDIIEGGSGANLAEVTAAYAGLSSLYSDLSTAVPSLSNVSPIIFSDPCSFGNSFCFMQASK